MRTRIIVVIILLFAVAFAAISYYTEIPFSGKEITEEKEKDSTEKKPRLLYGLNADDYIIETDTVLKGEFLADALMKHGVDYAMIDRLARQSRDVFDVRRIRPRKEYSVFKSKDSARTPRYFVYELNPADYVFFELGDSVKCHRGRNPVDTNVRISSGIIESSLWNSMIAAGDDPFLAVKLAEVYAWTIDFIGIKSGDNYRCIYEELIVDGNKIGLGRVIASCFNHIDKDYYAFYYKQDSIPEYFDQNGENMKRQFLKAPLKFSRVSSRFSYNRMHPILKRRRPHLGVDYAAPYGTPVRSVGNGTVIHAGYSGGAGRMVKVRHNHMYTTAYLHLSKYGPGIRRGRKVAQGQVIGYVGSSGLSTGPHLDFRYYKFGKAVNPMTIDAPPLEPVKEENMGKFLKYAEKMKKRLDSISVEPVEKLASDTPADKGN